MEGGDRSPLCLARGASRPPIGGRGLVGKDQGEALGTEDNPTVSPERAFQPPGLLSASSTPFQAFRSCSPNHPGVALGGYSTHPWCSGMGRGFSTLQALAGQGVAKIAQEKLEGALDSPGSRCIMEMASEGSPTHWWR